uniref:Uncharacterized protein n=1 Tax=Arundo donax TaxID=35708 RepID=A0A0A9BT63_ARUDO
MQSGPSSLFWRTRQLCLENWTWCVNKGRQNQNLE